MAMRAARSRTPGLFLMKRSVKAEPCHLYRPRVRWRAARCSELLMRVALPCLLDVGSHRSRGLTEDFVGEPVEPAWGASTQADHCHANFCYLNEHRLHLLA
jgi:hypothetical protein